MRRALARGLAVASALHLVLPAPLAVAAPAPAAVAETLHEEAKAAYARRDLRSAAELWRAAWQQDPQWKYAYNAANALYEDGLGDLAWRYLAEAERRGVPTQFSGQVIELRAKISGMLLRDHGWIALEVAPEDAEVLRDGEPWPAPRGIWVGAGESVVEVRREGYVPQRLTIAHEVGRRRTHAVALEEVPAPARVEVTGGPVGALVRVGGDLVGALPLEAPIALPPGAHWVEVTHPGFAPLRERLEVGPGEARLLGVELVPAAPPPAPAGDLATPGWLTLGGGALVLVSGAGFLGWAEVIAGDAAALQDDPARLEALGWEGYRRAYARERERFEDRRLAGWVLVGVGAVAVAAGAALVLWSSEEPATEGAVLGAVPLEGGGAVFGATRF